MADLDEKDVGETVKIAMIDMNRNAKERVREIMERSGRKVEIAGFAAHPYDRSEIGEWIRD